MSDGTFNDTKSIIGYGEYWRARFKYRRIIRAEYVRRNGRRSIFAYTRSNRRIVVQTLVAGSGAHRKTSNNPLKKPEE